MKIIHISKDEKFIDCAIEQFSWYENVESVFFVYCATKSPLYVKTRNKSVAFFSNVDDLIDSVNALQAEYVLLHSFCLNYGDLLKINHRIIWKMWGFDFYSDIYDRVQRIVSLDLYGKETRRGVTSIKRRLKFYIWRLAALCGKNRTEKKYNQLMFRVEYVATVFDEEYDLAKKRFPHLKFCPFQYFSGGESNFDFKDVSFEKPYSIFVGNSLDPTNNHLDILVKLEKLQKPVNVVMPISYSGSPEYKIFLKAECAKLKNVSIRFLETFMERSEYFKLAATCPFAIYGHRRQQAAGNIGQMLKDGVKVFLYKDSINYQYYNNRGYKVFSIDEDLNEENLKEPLAAKFVQQNRKAYVKCESTEEYESIMKKFLEGL